MEQPGAPTPSAGKEIDAPTENPKLTEVLEELSEEMEVRGIGQEPEVKVEEELDRATLEQTGIPASPPEESTGAAAPPEDQDAGMATDQEAAPVEEETRWVGNRRKMIVHPPGAATQLPAEENRVYFSSREEAVAAGYEVVEREDH